MDRLQFLEKVFSFYGKELNAKNRELLKDYDLALTTQKRVDWDNLYKKVIKDFETKNLPMPKWFIAKFDSCLLPIEGNYKINGGKGILYLAFKDKDSGDTSRSITYVFDMRDCPYSLAEIKNKFREKYKSSYQDFVYYPEGA